MNLVTMSDHLGIVGCIELDRSALEEWPDQLLKGRWRKSRKVRPKLGIDF